MPLITTTTKTIIYFENGLGNFILMTPAIQALASMDSTGKVDICLSSDWNDSRKPALIDICNSWDIIEDIIEFPKQNFKKKYDSWYYSLHTERSDAFKIFQVHNPKCGLSVHWGKTMMHEVEYYFEGVRRMGYKGPILSQYMPTSNKPTLAPSERPTVAICNGSFGKLKSCKQWPHFDKLVHTLKAVYNTRIIKIGYGHELEKVCGDIDYVGKLSITETAAVLKQVDLFITVDTGNMHIADALGVPTLAIFGGSLLSKNGPLSSACRIIKSGLPCQPCQCTSGLFDKCENPKCLSELYAGDVMSYINKFARENGWR